ncbi:MAG: epimerase [Proteobacteria bacterium]|nr:MAG: epimerase [Pseudomonadota bacterium]
MKKKNILITGAAGELGLSLIKKLLESRDAEITALDLRPVGTVSGFCNVSAGKITDVQYLSGDITDYRFLSELFASKPFDLIFHMAAVLSSGSERDPIRAHEVNVNGSMNLLRLCHQQISTSGRVPVFVFPSTIAVYGLGSLENKRAFPKVKEEQFLDPAGIYGMNKLYIENLGSYYSNLIPHLDGGPPRLDFRCVRFPGIICAETLPSGGTSDYASEMIHAAAQGKPYECFVREDCSLPFMAMPDAVDCLLVLSRAARSEIKRKAYNASGFSITAGQIREIAVRNFPQAKIGFKVSEWRCAIVDSWPNDIDDSAARSDWGWSPKFGLEAAFNDYLIPTIRKRYSNEASSCSPKMAVHQ